MSPGDVPMAEPMSGTLRAGSARLDITPAAPQFLDGYGNRTGRSEGSYHPIFVRALYAAGGGGEAVLVSAEVLAFDAAQVGQLRRAISRLSGVPERAIILLATHTHCAPRVGGQMVMPGAIDVEYTAFLGHRIVEAALQARATARPATVSISAGEGELGINRRLVTSDGCVMRPNPAGVNDPSLRTAWFCDRAGAGIASLTVYACHPTSRAGRLIGGDYPGFFSAALEANGAGTAIFALGCAGDIRPNFVDAQGRFRHAAVEEVRAAGEALAARVGRPGPVTCHRVSVTSGITRLPFASVPSPGALAQVAAKDPDPLRREWARRLLAESGSGLPDAADCEIQVLALPPGIAWIFMAGEMVVDFARALSRLADPLLIPAGYANASVGYVPSRRIYPEGGYEVDGACHYYGQPGPFTPQAEEIVIARARELLAEAMKAGPG